MKQLQTRKLTAIIMAITLLLSACVFGAMTAFAGDTDFTFDSETGVLTITGTGEMADYSETSLTTIPWYANRDDITSVVISEGITHVGDYSFCRETNLTSVTLPSTLTSIGHAAFAGNSSLTEITVPDSVTEVGDFAFGYAYDMSITEGFVAHCGNNSAAQKYCLKSYIPFDTPFDASGKDVATILEKNAQTMWSYVPVVNGTLKFWSVSGVDTFGLIYNKDYIYNDVYNEMQKSAVAKNDDNGIGDDTDFAITYKVTAGERYYLAAKCMSASKVNISFDVYMTFDCDEHSYEVISDTATCTEAGTKTYQCIGCGKTYTEVSPVLDHTPGEPTNENIVDATCIKKGSYDVVVRCTVCNTTISTKSEEIDYADHKYAQINVVDPTCTAEGYTEYQCSVCLDTVQGDTTQKIAHTPGEMKVEDVVDPTCDVDGSYNEVIRCTVCTEILESTPKTTDMTGHNYVHSTVAPTCTKDGAELDTCQNCGDVISDPIPALGHSYTAIDFAAGEVGAVCGRCDKYKTYTFMDYLNGENAVLDIVEDGIVNAKDYAKFRREYPAPDVACDIDLAAGTVSRENATLADGVLTLTPNGRYSIFNITGDATGVQVVVNADRDVEIKLNNATLSVDSANAITINNTATDGTIPTVSISASEGTNNAITTTTTGNAVANYSDNGACKLEIKGHGTLVLNTASTAINSGGKIEIKNITLDITSGNRGMDTKFTDAAGLDDYASIDVAGNANITIKSTDDGIRCKNFETKALAAGNVDTVININAGGDGIQMEGKKSAFNSGNITITANGYAFNCAAANFKVNAGATIDATGKKGYSK